MIDARMAAEQFDHGSEWERREKFVGRAALLARLDQLLVDSDTDRWVVVTGGPGVGKTALLTAWLSRREAEGALIESCRVGDVLAGDRRDRVAAS